MRQKAIHALLVEDNAGDVDLIRLALSRAETQVEVTVASTLEQACQALKEQSWDVLLADLSLPDSHGLQTVADLHRAASQTPLVVLTSLASDETAMQALEKGAQDYLVKDEVTAEMLDRAIQYAVQRQNSADVQQLLERMRSNERILAKKNRRLEELYKTAHRFVDNVSHEFRTPLTVIMEYVALLREEVIGSLDDDQHKMLDIVADRAVDLNNMVNDMLDISKLEAGMLGIWRRNCSLHEAIDHVRENLLQKASVKQVELQFDVPNNLPRIYCDDEKIGRVLVNLITNAIKFSGRPGLVKVWAKTCYDQGEIVVGVTDNGKGICQDNLNAIFQRFRQLGSNPRGSTKGFGLGLNIARELVYLNLGDINVTSKLGEGSTFYFTIPIASIDEVSRRYAERLPHLCNGTTAISLVRVSLTEPAESHMEEDIHRFLNTLLRRHDLLFHIHECRWLFALPAEQAEMESFYERVETTRKEANRNRPCDPLPPLNLSLFGAWTLPDQIESMLEAVREMSQPACVGA